VFDGSRNKKEKIGYLKMIKIRWEEKELDKRERMEFF
jgi:hypothetical protein